MATAIRQQVESISDCDQWLPINEAVRITGESLRSWQFRCQAEEAKARRTGRPSLAVKAPTGDGKRSVWHLSRRFDARLARSIDRNTRDDKDRVSLLERFPKHQVESAYRKAFWLRRWNVACQRRRSSDVTEKTLADQVASEAREADADDFAISHRSLQVWRRAYEARGADGQIRGIAGLIDGRSLASSNGRTGDDKGSSGNRDLHAIDYFYRLYHTESRQSVRVCHEVTVHEARAERWAWPASYSATREWLRRYDDQSTTYLLRHGTDAWCRRFMPYHEIDYTLIEPGAMYQTDHHICDFWIEHEGTQLRPWLTVVQDLRSRMICGHHLGVSPHTDAIVACYLNAFKRYAIPESLRIDNGKDFASRLLTGVTKATRDRLRREHGADWRKVLRRDSDLVECVDSRFVGITEELGISTVFAIPYAPWSKGTTERWFGTFEGRCGKTMATYCGNSAFNKPECLEAIRRGYTSAQKRRLRKKHGRDWKRIAVLRFVDTSAVPTLDDAKQAVADWIDDYHHTSHTADDMGGRTPIEVWNTATSLRRAGDAELLALMQSRGVYRVGPQGVAFKIGGTRMRYGAGCPAIYKYIGRDVFITIDPSELSVCYAFTAERDNRRFVGRLDANERISPMATVDDLRDANATVGRRRKVMHKAQRESVSRTRTASQELAAKRRERAEELRATGTDQGSNAQIVPVRTGFEGCAQQAAAPRSKGTRTDRRSTDLLHAADAMGFNYHRSEPETQPKRRTDTLDLITPNISLTKDDASPMDGCGGNDGRDAETPRLDLLSLVSGNQHERTE